MMKRKINVDEMILVAMAIVGIFIFIYNYFYLNIPALNVMALFLILIGPVIFQYTKYTSNKNIETRFPDFLRDVSENIRSGMTLPQAVRATKKNDYGALTPFVKRMAVQIDWGIPFDDVLEGLDIKSKIVRRTISVIIETHRGGGRISDTLDAVGRSVAEINKLRKERTSSLYSQVITGYIIFFVFLGVLVTLQTFLVPSLSVVTTSDLGSGMSAESIGTLYSNVFQWMILIQGVFSGLVIGKMSEGSIFMGVKHSIVLGLVGYIVILFFI